MGFPVVFPGVFFLGLPRIPFFRCFFVSSDLGSHRVFHRCNSAALRMQDVLVAAGVYLRPPLQWRRVFRIIDGDIKTILVKKQRSYATWSRTPKRCQCARHGCLRFWDLESCIWWCWMCQMVTPRERWMLAKEDYAGLLRWIFWGLQDLKKGCRWFQGHFSRFVGVFLFKNAFLFETRCLQTFCPHKQQLFILVWRVGSNLLASSESNGTENQSFACLPGLLKLSFCSINPHFTKKRRRFCQKKLRAFLEKEI